MTAEILIRPLARGDDRSEFSCGEAALDRYLRDYAGQNQFRLHLAVTWVAVPLEREDRILGFATVAAGSIERSELPTNELRRRLPAYPLPVLRLARLGVHEQAQGLGIGRELLRHVLLLAVRQRDMLGCVGVVTDAKANAVSFYQSLGFIELAGVRQGLLHGDPTPMFLGLATVEAALR